MAQCKPHATLLLQRAQAQAVLHERDHDWAELVARLPKRADSGTLCRTCRHRSALYPLYVRHDR